MKIKLPISVFIFVFIVLSFVQMKVPQPMLLAERFWYRAGWIELFVVALYGSFVAYRMQDIKQTAVWRKRIWLVFTFVFFAQLALGLIGYDKFLMTGKLHFPIPKMILSGPLYRGQLSFMTILFLSTIILSGPAWCSQLCYFGGIDALAARGRSNARAIKHKMPIKYTGLVLVSASALLLRWMQFTLPVATILASIFGIGGLAVIAMISRKRKKMFHCVVYCPIGTLVAFLKFANPFRMTIDKRCDTCMKCSLACQYDALSIQDIRNKRPGLTCTLCGDCIAQCKTVSIQYRLWKLSPTAARNLYLFLTISLHTIFLALGRI